MPSSGPYLCAKSQEQSPPPLMFTLLCPAERLLSLLHAIMHVKWAAR
jgi:hypothetical protein